VIWYLADMGRFKREQEAVHQLEREADWLVGCGWGTDLNLRLLYRFELKVSGETIALTMRYGHGFPSAPPSVFPDPPRGLSGHQYVNGDLCLEYGPDTWVPDVMGADLLRSAYRLLSGEAAAPLDPALEVPSRHELTVGQVARSEDTRFVVTAHLKAFLAGVPRGRVGAARFRFLYNYVTAVFLLVSVDDFSEERWRDPGLPPALTKDRTLGDGVVVTTAVGVVIPAIADRAAIERFLRDQGITAPASEIDTVLIHSDTETRLVWFSDEGKTLPVLTLRATEGPRSSRAHADLKSKTVGIVGCGSLGSKIAVILARAGIGNFVLVDDDIFLPENLVRNELAWSDVGQHKADAVAKRIELVAPGAKSTVRRQRVGGQESNSVADSTIRFLQDCDLIIDSSAEATVFNILSGAATSSSKPLVWAEVFAGGIGGLIARSRPGTDAPPQAMRAGIDAWCAAQGVAAPRPVTAYGAETAQGAWIADDADVTTIAAHATRFTIDLLLARVPSAYPCSCYLIGLAEAWVFRAPFDTIPIDLSTLPLTPASPSTESDPETFAAILELISKGNADSRPTP
jgi:molybdopterin/thiamine biosynthesis adenylyltransferase